jgi:hypothetical protein
MSMDLEKQRNMTCTDVTPTHGMILELVQEVEGVGHKMFMDNYFISPKLFSDLHHKKINACSTVHDNSRKCHLSSVLNIRNCPEYSEI